MLFEAEEFQTRLSKPAGWTDHFFRYCNFKHISSEGGDIDSVFIGCTLEDCEWYWGLFNGAVLVNVKFKSCTFRGTSFAGSKFVECEFHDCVFTKDNLNGDCSFNGVKWYNCIQKNCRGLEEEFRNKR
ncbi:MAG TPA: pentapeptide repeat-containing protein [Burkholderiaceae bacterium]